MALKFKLETEFKIELDGEIQKYRVSSKSDPKNHVVSAQSALGSALLEGKNRYTPPSGREKQFTIISIEREGQHFDLGGFELQEIFQVFDLVESDQIDLSIDPPYLDDRDTALALHWLDSEQSLQSLRNAGTNPRKSILGNRSLHEDYELGRVLSARAAEKAALEIYERWGASVSDISVSQIDHPSGGDWQQFDLVVDGEPVDVKNSRRSKSNPQSYVEHCVPAFKSSRGNREVIIAGILSEYLWPISILKQKRTYGKSLEPLIFLGETRRSDLLSLRRTFEIPEVFSMRFAPVLNGGLFLLPSWVFDLPNHQYAHRNEAMEELRQKPTVQGGLGSLLNLNFAPLYLAAGIEDESAWTGIELNDRKLAFRTKVFEWRRREPLSLPRLYLSILTHFIETVHELGSRTGSFYPRRAYRSMVYLRPDDPLALQFPLLNHDPLRTISILIDTLDTAWRECREKLSTFTSYKLSNLNILKGYHENSSPNWQTIIAYCGGWIEDEIKCGNTPLVMGDSDNCPECGRLICPICTFCAHGCSQGRGRT